MEAETIKRQEALLFEEELREKEEEERQAARAEVCGCCTVCWLCGVLEVPGQLAECCAACAASSSSAAVFPLQLGLGVAAELIAQLTLLPACLPARLSACSMCRLTGRSGPRRKKRPSARRRLSG